ncbi:serine-rich adhesin for platelets-like [Ptychodera flava]|uniref:serine-rich adhesin for platelets-like n=1 Tax=Ptychodera flava TaxID=63121 RepID=UPI003969E2B3
MAREDTKFPIKAKLPSASQTGIKDKSIAEKEPEESVRSALTKSKHTVTYSNDGLIPDRDKKSIRTNPVTEEMKVLAAHQMDQETGGSLGYKRYKESGLMRDSWKVRAKRSYPCGGTLTDPSGYITSPLYPSYYTAGTLCTWMIQACETCSIEIKFIDLDLPGRKKAGCNLRKAYVHIRSFRGQNLTGSEYYCRTEIPDVIRPDANEVVVNFKTYKNRNMRGFKLQYIISDSSGISENTSTFGTTTMYGNESLEVVRESKKYASSTGTGVSYTRDNKTSPEQQAKDFPVITNGKATKDSIHTKSMETEYGRSTSDTLVTLNENVLIADIQSSPELPDLDDEGKPFKILKPAGIVKNTTGVSSYQQDNDSPPGNQDTLTGREAILTTAQMDIQTAFIQISEDDTINGHTEFKVSTGAIVEATQEYDSNLQSLQNVATSQRVKSTSPPLTATAFHNTTFPVDKTSSRSQKTGFQQTIPESRKSINATSFWATSLPVTQLKPVSESIGSKSPTAEVEKTSTGNMSASTEMNDVRFSTFEESVHSRANNISDETTYGTMRTLGNSSSFTLDESTTSPSTKTIFKMSSGSSIPTGNAMEISENVLIKETLKLKAYVGAVHSDTATDQTVHVETTEKVVNGMSSSTKYQSFPAKYEVKSTSPLSTTGHENVTLPNFNTTASFETVAMPPTQITHVVTADGWVGSDITGKIPTFTVKDGHVSDVTAVTTGKPSLGVSEMSHETSHVALTHMAPKNDVSTSESATEKLRILQEADDVSLRQMMITAVKNDLHVAKTTIDKIQEENIEKTKHATVAIAKGNSVLQETTYGQTSETSLRTNSLLLNETTVVLPTKNTTKITSPSSEVGDTVQSLRTSDMAWNISRPINISSLKDSGISFETTPPHTSKTMSASTEKLSKHITIV